MPPKVKTNRDTIINAAFEAAREEGITAITAQRVSTILNTSVAPIFREFQTIEELRTATAERINVFHTQYLQNYRSEDSKFLTYGIAYIHFAKEYPHLFEILMQHGDTTLHQRMSRSLTFVVDSAVNKSGLSYEQAKELFFNLWIYTHGIACLVYKGGVAIKEHEEKELLINAYEAFKINCEQCEILKEKDTL